MNEVSERTGPAVEARIQELLEALTLDEKIGMIHAATKFTTGGVERLGIPPLQLSDGPHGVREEISADSWEPAGRKDDTCTYLPVGTAQAATFDPGLVKKAGEVLGAESRDRGKDIILGPGINLLRTPLCGRIFEYYSEDPWLNGELAIAAVEGIQSRDTGACVKHFALNNQELNRGQTDVVIDDKTLYDHYLSAFERVVKETGLVSIMGAYNRYKNVHCCQNRILIQEILKDDWGFKGLVVTDWNAVFDTNLAVESGLDLEMGTAVPDYDAYFMARPYLDGIREGRFPESGLDEKVRRILRVMHRIGIFDPNRKSGARNTTRHQKIALEIARESIVLLKNGHNQLPMNPSPGETVLVIGLNAVMRHASGGNSSAVKAAFEITPLEGLESGLPEGVRLEFAAGYSQSSSGLSSIPTASMATVDEGSGVKGWKASYFANRHIEGAPVKSDFVETVAWDLGKNELPPEIPSTMFSIKWEGAFIPEESGSFTLACFMDGVAKVTVNGNTLLDIPHASPPSLFEAPIELEAGSTYHIVVSYGYRDSCQKFEFGFRRPGEPASSAIQPGKEALEQARQAHHVLFVGGLDHQFDLESRDRKDLELPYGQDALLTELLKTRPDTIVTLLAGSPVAMPWIEACHTLIWMSYAGMQGGTAWAEILLGKVNPSGHLPFSFPKCLKETGPHALGTYEEASSTYSEKELTGYRYHLQTGIDPLFYFGAGLSYGTIEIVGSEARVEEEGLQVNARLRCPRENPLVLRKALQVYIQLPGYAYPVLKGLSKVTLIPGEVTEIAISIPMSSLRQYEADAGARVVLPGRYPVHVGFSANELVPAANLEIA